MNRPEQALQKAIVRFLEAALPRGWLVQHVANNPRSAVAGAAAKAMGAKAGFPDLVIFGRKASGPDADGAMAYMIEVKPPKVSVPAYQREMHDRLKDIGFPVGVARSIDDVVALGKAWQWPMRGRV